MKIRKGLLQTDTARNQRVFRVDDEIEVVLQDVDNLSTAINNLKDQKSIEAVWNRNPDWLGKIKPFVLAGFNGGVADGRGQRACKRKTSLSSVQLKQELIEQGLPNGVCVSRPIGSVLREQNGDPHPVTLQIDMSDLKPKIKMTPPNEVLVMDSDAEEFTAEALDNPPPPLVNGKVETPLKCDTVTSNTEAPDDHELSPSSVVEVQVGKKEIPTINLEDGETEDHVSLTCNGKAEQSHAETKTDATTREDEAHKFQAVGKVKKRSKNTELERLFVSLKEIPWAQNWSPKTFLTRNPKTMFLKRYQVRNSVKDDKNGSKLLLKDPVVSKPPNLQKDNAKNLGDKDSGVFPNEKMAVVKSTLEPAKKKRKVAPPFETRSSNGVAETTRKRSPVSKTSEMTSSADLVKSGPSHKLSTDLAIKEYDASKVSKLKSGVKKKVGVTSCSVAPQPSLSNLCLPPKIPAVKSTQTSYRSACQQSTIPALFRKDIVKANSANDSSKPRVKVSPKILPFTPIPKCNGMSAVKVEGCSSIGNGNENRLGSEQLLQKQLVSVMGKETNDTKKRKVEDESLRYSVRQSECAFRYKEIAVKKHLNYIQIILVPNRTRHNGLTLEALHELREALISAKKDQSCKVLLLNSCGSIFCSGIDLASLVGQPHMTEKISTAVRSLIETLALFSKPVVAAVNGAAVGLGVTLLTYCDVVFASEKATFFTPYARLGHIPEGAMTLVLPQVVGSLVASDMLLRDRKLTAFQASIYGLVSEVIWPSQFMESVIPRVEAMASQSGQAMESTKILLRYHQWDKLQSTLEHESRLLPLQWQSEQCQEALRAVLTQPGGLIDW